MQLASNSENAGRASSNGKATPCHFFRIGKCRYGRDCLFAHSPSQVPPTDSLSSSAGAVSADLSNSPQDPRSRLPCHDYLHGRCLNGGTCPYAHPEEAISEGSSQGGEEFYQPNAEDDPENYSRELAGAFVQFEEGARISKIALPSDFSTVRINGLPSASTKSSVSTLLRWLGFELGPNSVRICESPETSTVSADVEAEDPSFAKKCCARLNADKPPVSSYSGLEAVAIPGSPRLVAYSRRIDCKTVLVSWLKSTRHVWLDFKEEEVAQRVSDKFNDTTYIIRGYKVSAEQPMFSTSDRLPWTVMLKNVDGNANEKHIRKSVPLQLDKPKHIELSHVLGTFDGSEIPVFVGSLFESVGPVKFEWGPLLKRSRRVRGVARFEEDSDATKAVQELHDKQQGFLKGGRLTVQLLNSAKFKIKTAIYVILKEQLLKRKLGWKKRNVKLKVYRDKDRLRQFTTVKAQGEDAKEVANAANTLEQLFSGRIIKNGDAILWSSSIARNGTQLQILRYVQREHDIILRRNKAKRRLEFFGPPEKYWPVQRDLVKLIETDQSAEEDVKAARIADAHRSCTICWAEAENPILTRCNHLYCFDCFEDLCMSNGSTDEFSIRCQGDLANCKRTFTLGELQDHLSSVAFEEVLEASFASHVRRHPSTFRYCPTPDCGYIYRAGVDARTHTCPKCLETVCVACHERHGLLSCADFSGDA